MSQTRSFPRVFDLPWPTCECGCGRPVLPAPYTERRKGWVKGQPLRFLRGHTGGPKAADWNDIVVTETGCHIFGSYEYPEQGYRRVRWKGESVAMHFMLWEKTHGPVPKGYHVHHRCEDKRCVNLEHLELLTHGEHSTLHHKGKPSPGSGRWASSRGSD